MPCFEEFNTENKLRIPLSTYAAQIIENDCMAFSQKRTTLINTVIMNYYQHANCTISLKLRDFRNELKNCLPAKDLDDEIIDKLVEGRARTLSDNYIKRKPADVNWQITLNKRVKEFLTQDTYTCEEQYYGQRPGRYVRSLIEEYTLLSFHRREEIVFKDILNNISIAIRGKHVLTLTNTKGFRISIRPYSIETDPLSTYHYLIGYSVPLPSLASGQKYPAKVQSIRISRLEKAEIQFLQSANISLQEEHQIQKEIKEKTVQFVSGKSSIIKVYLTDKGIKKYDELLHLRPIAIGKEADDHVYLFECTEAQIKYYFYGFGKEVKIIEPASLAAQFYRDYIDAADQYKKQE